MTAVQQVASQGQDLQEHTGRACADELNRRQQLSAATDRALKDATNTMESTISSSTQLASQGDWTLHVDCHKAPLWCRCFTVAVWDWGPQPCWVEQLVLKSCNRICPDTRNACQQSADQHRTMCAVQLNTIAVHFSRTLMPLCKHITLLATFPMPQ